MCKIQYSRRSSFFIKKLPPHEFIFAKATVHALTYDSKRDSELHFKFFFPIYSMRNIFRHD